MKFFRIATIFILANLVASDGNAQDLTQRRIPIDLPRMTGPIDLDGVINEPAWAAIDPYPITVYSPTYGAPPTEQTEFRVGYDDQYLYVAGHMYDSNPDAIESNSFYRDSSSGEDIMGVVIDSYNDFETALSFIANPNGARTDRSIANDALWVLGRPSYNNDWNAPWDLATQRTEEGWFAEMRIPFSVLGFQVVDDTAIMGLGIYRTIQRKNERHVYPDNSPAWGWMGFGKPSLAQRVRLTGVKPETPLYITPYALGGLTQTPIIQGSVQEGNEFYGVEELRTGELGLDIKYSPSSSLAIDLTANTDFAQVEADDQQINLTRFPLFFPEKRQFFQERSSTFEFGVGGFTDRLFFSRRIGLKAGELQRIYGGGRVVGRMGGLDYGMLNMQTADENMGVFRLKQEVINPFSYVGGMVTTRLGSLGESNIAYGLDSEIRLFGDEYVTVKWAQTFDEVVNEGSPLDAGLIRARWEHRKQEGFAYSADYGRVGPDYLPGLGFQSRKDFSFYGGQAGYTWFGKEGSKLRAITLGTETEHYYRNEDGAPESRKITPSFMLGLNSGGFFIFSLNSSFESIRNPFRVAGITIDPGEYWFQQSELMFRFPLGLPWRGSFNASAGSFYDGRRVSVGVSPSFNITSHLEVETSYEINRFEFENQDLSTQLASLRLNFALNTHLSLRAFGQYNSVVDQSTVNARIRYHFSEGTDLWIVYNAGFNLERDNFGGPGPNRLPLYSGRTLMVKYSHRLTF